MNNNILLYSTGKYNLNPATSHKEKEYEKEIYTYIKTQSLCCKEEINNIVNQLCFDKIFKWVWSFTLR